MSVYTVKTGVTSILKAYSPTERDKAKNAILNKVRFTMPKQKGIVEAVQNACATNNFQPVNDFISFLKESELSDDEFTEILSDARKIANDLSPKFTQLVEALLSLPWTKHSPESVNSYVEFFIEILVAHNKYIAFGVHRMIAMWIPADADINNWSNGIPHENLKKELIIVHDMVYRVMNAVPMAINVIIDALEEKFPYFKKPTHVIAGYLYNVLRLMEAKPILVEVIMQLVLQKALIFDVHAPRTEIEEMDDDDEQMEMFEIVDITINSPRMKHPIAQTLDICMEKLFVYVKDSISSLSQDENITKPTRSNKLFKILIQIFDEHILPSHNTHHVQFLMFYTCSFKNAYADAFLISLWDKVQSPNVSSLIRQAAIFHIASFLARAKFLPIVTLKQYIKELCDWAHSYIERCDTYRSNGSLKSNLVFYSVCQAIFYVIAFRSRDLTADKKGLLFMQSLHLPALVTCNLNPLRVCLPPVATAFAGVTRTYQLAYCHAILERNARRKLATVYVNDVATPEETLDTFFPYDPYLLKNSNKYIEPIYIKYRASEAEENTNIDCSQYQRLKRGDSEMNDDSDMDDFLIADKRRKTHDLVNSLETDAKFVYGLSPKF